MEKVEKENIQREKSTIGADDRNQKKNIVFFDTFLDGGRNQYGREGSGAQE